MTSARATAVTLLICIFGSLLFLVAVDGGRKVMCATHRTHDGSPALSYCEGYGR